MGLREKRPDREMENSVSTETRGVARGDHGHQKSIKRNIEVRERKDSYLAITPLFFPGLTGL